MGHELMVIVACPLCEMRATAAPEHEGTWEEIPVKFSRPLWWPQAV